MKKLLANGKTIHLHMGEHRLFSANGNPETGYVWTPFLNDLVNKAKHDISMANIVSGIFHDAEPRLHHPEFPEFSAPVSNTSPLTSADTDTRESQEFSFQFYDKNSRIFVEEYIADPGSSYGPYLVSQWTDNGPRLFGSRHSMEGGLMLAEAIRRNPSLGRYIDNNRNAEPIHRVSGDLSDGLPRLEYYRVSMANGRDYAVAEDTLIDNGIHEPVLSILPINDDGSVAFGEQSRICSISSVLSCLYFPSHANEMASYFSRDSCKSDRQEHAQDLPAGRYVYTSPIGADLNSGGLVTWLGNDRESYANNIEREKDRAKIIAMQTNREMQIAIVNIPPGKVFVDNSGESVYQGEPLSSYSASMIIDRNGRECRTAEVGSYMSLGL